MTDSFINAVTEVSEYGVAMGWVHKGTDICDAFETLSNMHQLDEDGNLEDDIRPSFLIVWNNFGKLLALADSVKATGV